MQYVEEAREPYGSFRHLFEALICQRKDRARLAQPHYQQTYEILYGLEGSCTILLGTKSYTMRKGDMALFDPMECHCVDAITEHCGYGVVKFAKELVCPCDCSMEESLVFLEYENARDSHRKIFPAEELGDELPQRILRILECNRTREHGYQLRIRSDVTWLFCWILQHTPILAEHSAYLDAVDTHRIQRALEYIDGHFAEDISLTAVAEHCNMGYTNLSRLFTQAMRTSFSEYLLRRRLEYADFLLATTDESVTDIAMETGFSSISYFILCFRKQRGVTPAQFRKRFHAPNIHAKEEIV